MQLMRRLGALGLLGFWISVLPVVAAASKPPASPRPAIESIETALQAGTAFRDVAIAPDGRRVAWVEALLDAEGLPSGKLTLRTVPLGAAASEGTVPAPPTTIDLPGDGAAFPAFSLDGRRLAFLADDGRTSQLQIWLADLSSPSSPGKKGGAPGPALRRLTSFAGQLADLRWLPDGLGLTALAIEGRMEAAGPLAAHPRDAGLVGEHPDVQRIARFDAATGALRWASPSGLFVYQYDASPDGSAFVATAARGEGDAKWWVAKLVRFGADQPAGEVLHETKLQMAMPRWSPDGRNVAWLEGLMSDASSTGGDVWTLPLGAPAEGAESGNRPAARNVTPGLASSPAWLAWSGPDRLLWVENVAGSTGISTVDLATGRIESRWRGAEALSLGGSPGLALAADGKTSAAIRHSFQAPPEVWAGEIGAWRQITKRNADVHPLWGAAKDLRWTSDGLEIQGWLLAPPDPQPGKRQALIVLVHGGPSASHRPGWPTMAGVLAQAGFYVLMPNPRGSFGYGTAFQAANVKDFGYGDFRDIERGVDAAVANAPKEAPIDPARVGIFGWSYGGYMVMWAVAKSDRFAAAVAGAGIANWQSYAGQNRIDDWLVPFFGATVEEDPWIYARSSPITFISHAKTPTLVLHGERDSEVPAPQGYEFWKALRRLGVPTELYIFADQGHRLNPAGERERYARTVDWFRRWLVEPAESPTGSP